MGDPPALCFLVKAAAQRHSHRSSLQAFLRRPPAVAID